VSSVIAPESAKEYLDALVKAAEAEEQERQRWQSGAAESLPPEPEYQFSYDLLRGEPPAAVYTEPITLDAARERVESALDAYLDEPEPDYALLIKALPGTGKTTAGVRASEILATKHQRVLYAGPRHDFYGDIMEIAADPDLWYEWLPRQAESETKIETCKYAEQIDLWLTRGYRGIDFCERICGWDHVGNGCVYHGQKKRHEPCIFGQHQHVSMGHPLEFSVVIGDESPLGAFCWVRRIPGRWVTVPGIAKGHPLAVVLTGLRSLCEQGVTTDGESLLGHLGGAAFVAQACAEADIPLDPHYLAPDIQNAKDVAEVPYAYLHQLVPILEREAGAAAQGIQYLHRVVVHKGHLQLYLRRPVDDKLPRYIAWLDATADERIYRACLQRKVRVVDAQPELRGRIYQVWSRANGKGTLLSKEGVLTPKAGQLEAQVRRVIERGGYQSPAIISFQKVVDGTPTFEAMPNSHFYAARGTNALEDCDALIVAGTPQPRATDIQTIAVMLFQERLEAFTAHWSAKWQSYNYIGPDGKGARWPVGGFWGEPDLVAVLWSLREAEIIQAAHRARPVNREVDIWLLTNLPVRELPPTELMSLRELYGAPEGVRVFGWSGALDWARSWPEPHFTTGDMVRGIDIDWHTARKYVQALAQEHPGEFRLIQAEPGRGCGRPGLVVEVLANSGQTP